MENHLNLDLDLAWQRVKSDIDSGRQFVVHPYEQALIEENLDVWIRELKEDLLRGTYVPDSISYCEYPKPSGAIRPGGILGLRDQVVYAACIGSCLAKLREFSMWGSKQMDFSYPLHPNSSHKDWFDNYSRPFVNWRKFNSHSLDYMSEEVEYVVCVDIAGYYENIDLSMLSADLRGCGIDGDILNVLSKCLNKWAYCGRGIPQGFSPSDILGKIYLTMVDQGLAQRGYNHLRYVDDFRIFCPNYPTARRAFVELVNLLRQRGLIIQTAKSKIYTVSDARMLVDGVQPVLDNIKQEWMSEIARTVGFSEGYFTQKDVEAMFAADVNGLPDPKVLSEAYERFFKSNEAQPFNKTLFRFILNKLKSTNSDYAYPHCLRYLFSHPDETETILNYVYALGRDVDANPTFIEVLATQGEIYTHQSYWMFYWLLKMNRRPSPDMLVMVRRFAFDLKVYKYVELISAEILAKWGNWADIERMRQALNRRESDLGCAETLCQLRRLDATQRNAILGRYPNDMSFTGRAVRLIKSKRRISFFSE